MSNYVIARLESQESDVTSGGILMTALRRQADQGGIGEQYAVWTGISSREIGERSPDYVVIVSAYGDALRLDPVDLPPVAL